jgi:hypothetical protein
MTYLRLMTIPGAHHSSEPKTPTTTASVDQTLHLNPLAPFGGPRP